jgi:hypothetical protein
MRIALGHDHYETGPSVHYRPAPGPTFTSHAITITQPPAWYEQALCPQVDVGDIFYPPKGGPSADAIRICDRCPVENQCLTYALENNERYGVWGGKSERQRRRIKRDLGGAA